jgi:hypothetical protein
VGLRVGRGDRVGPGQRSLDRAAQRGQERSAPQLPRLQAGRRVRHDQPALGPARVGLPVHQQPLDQVVARALLQIRDQGGPGACVAVGRQGQGQGPAMFGGTRGGRRVAVRRRVPLPGRHQPTPIDTWCTPLAEVSRCGRPPGPAAATTRPSAASPARPSGAPRREKA